VRGHAAREGGEGRGGRGVPAVAEEVEPRLRRPRRCEAVLAAVQRVERALRRGGFRQGLRQGWRRLRGAGLRRRRRRRRRPRRRSRRRRRRPTGLRVQERSPKKRKVVVQHDASVWVKHTLPQEVSQRRESDRRKARFNHDHFCCCEFFVRHLPPGHGGDRERMGSLIRSKHVLSSSTWSKRSPQRNSRVRLSLSAICCLWNT
jgi:hypothetical protein